MDMRGGVGLKGSERDTTTICLPTLVDAIMLDIALVLMMLD